MSHWAEVDNNNTVIRVLVGNNYGDEGYQWLVDNLSGTWVKTSYNAATNGFRKNYAGIGYSYWPDLDAFVAPKCHDEAVLDETTAQWNCSNLDHQIKLGEI